ncbi:hypothetical protein CHS0354_040019 [Potamilus streckersoni]|uniref:Uncharacterized protein n=1 Tax=Potamilus streckersoni TaxID=2493646 RepID=A0AAE0STT9_9BIVA|nr:hypothetical protein CHS0354_040019 [Potamilus streckersoni]
MNCQVCKKTFTNILMCVSCKVFICQSCTTHMKWKCTVCGKQISVKCSIIQDDINMTSSTVDEEARVRQSEKNINNAVTSNLKMTILGIWLCMFTYTLLIYIFIPCFYFVLTNLIYPTSSFLLYYVILVPGSYTVMPIFNTIYPYTMEPLIHYGTMVFTYVIVYPFEFVASLTNKYIWVSLLSPICQYIMEFITLIFLLIAFVTSSCYSLVKWIISTPYCLYCERNIEIFIDWHPVGFGVANVFLFAAHSLRTILYVFLVPTLLLSLVFLFAITFQLCRIRREEPIMKDFISGISYISNILNYLYKGIFEVLATAINN